MGQEGGEKKKRENEQTSREGAEEIERVAKVEPRDSSLSGLPPALCSFLQPGHAR